MTHEIRAVHSSFLLVALLAIGCGENRDSDLDDAAATGGQSAASAGESSSGGESEPAATGGRAPASGGQPGTGGSPDPTGGQPSATGGVSGGASSTPLEPGVTLELPESESTSAEREALAGVLEPVADLSLEGFRERYAVQTGPTPSYELDNVAGLDTIQASALALDEVELAALAGRGFAISDRQLFPSFVYGYHTLYSEDLPLYVSADSILFAVHRSYDEMLKNLELNLLIGELRTLLDGMRAKLADGGAESFGADARADADLLLAVAASLLGEELVAPVAGGDAAQIQSLFDSATAADGWIEIQLFGVQRDEDFSQYKPRGHYTDAPALEAYFRAMMWLGRVDLRILETQPDGSQLFRRRQLEGAYVLRELIDTEMRPSFDRIDRTVSAFVGEHDYMVLPELDLLLADLELASAAELDSLDDETIATAVVAGGYGAQRISSHIMINGMSDGTLPLSASFALFGQRYVIDSHVFSNVVFDRVGGGGTYRMLPSPLDAAFAALGNDQAGVLLDAELETYGYAPDLAAMRELADAHPSEFWQENLYNLWLGSLRELSPARDADPTAEGLSPAMRSEAWARRLLNTQLASWAELRHDTILYAKQSYTAGEVCEFPDAYVDPYPAFYRAIAEYANRGQTLLADLNLPATDAYATYFQRLSDVALTLETMAEHELTGLEFTPEMMAFINQAVVIQFGCGSPFGADGWYIQLFANWADGIEFDPTIADVHTQPTDEVGNPVGKVLHVATGQPRLMVAIAEGCSGPRAYAGLASSYFERVTMDFERVDDPTWAQDIQLNGHPADPSYLEDLVTRP